MSTVLAREVRAIQNPALGAVLLWRFALGYASTRANPESTPMPVLFLALPILLHAETLNVLAHTQAASGLRGFAAKFSDSKISESDVLLSLERRARSLRPLSLASLQVATTARLLFVDPARAEVVALSGTPPASAPAGVRPLLKGAEKLGKWCGEVTLFELASVLRVGF
jgi:hypothetical protein